MAYDSIYYYKGIGEFKRFIQRIDDGTLSFSSDYENFKLLESNNNVTLSGMPAYKLVYIRS